MRLDLSPGYREARAATCAGQRPTPDEMTDR
jgi:hypothetical protein